MNHPLRFSITLVVALSLSWGPRADARSVLSFLFKSGGERFKGVDQATFSCASLPLVGAGGVPAGEIHRYALRGICRKGFRDGPSEDVWLEVHATYNTRTNEANEVLIIELPQRASISTTMKCTEDPWPDGAVNAKCLIAARTGDGEAVSAANRAPITRNIVNLGEAARLSARPANTAAPPPAPAAAPPSIVSPAHAQRVSGSLQLTIRRAQGTSPRQYGLQFESWDHQAQRWSEQHPLGTLDRVAGPDVDMQLGIARFRSAETWRLRVHDEPSGAWSAWRCFRTLQEGETAPAIKVPLPQGCSAQ